VDISDRIAGSVLDAGCGTGENALFCTGRDSLIPANETPHLGDCEPCKCRRLSVVEGVFDPGDGKVFRKLRTWWQLRKLEQDRAFLLAVGYDPRSQELLPLIEEEIARLRLSQIKLRYPHNFFKDKP
jgi:hypothetical protein